MKRIRQESPPSFSDYRKYKPFLRTDFDYQCAYCESREPELGGEKRTHIDHYKPKKKFPNLATLYANLFYSCPECNQSKKDYWPTVSQRLAKQFILNPSDHDFSRHFDRSSANWRGLTLAGRWNISKLLLSSAEQVRRRDDRKVLVDLVAELEDQIRLAKAAADSARKMDNISGARAASTTIDKLRRRVEALRAKCLSTEQIQALPSSRQHL